jgi:hypothetical protein
MQVCAGKDMKDLGHGTVAVCKKCLAESGGVALLLSGERTSINHHARKAHRDAFVTEDMVKYGDARVLQAMTMQCL